MAVNLFRLLLFAYPPSLRREHGAEMRAVVAARWNDQRTVMARVRFIRDLLADFFTSWPREWRISRMQGHAPRQLQRWPGRDVSTDMRTATRLFTRAPLFAAGAVLTLALGIGATTAIFSLADATLLHPLPLTHPEQVLEVDFSWSPPEVREFATAQHAFSDVAAWTTPDMGLTENGITRNITVSGVTGRYFDLTGLRPLVGRLLNDTDDQRNATPVAVLGERLWRTRFGGDPRILGRTITLNRRDVTVVGVAPTGFRGLALSDPSDLFLPLWSLPTVGTGFLTRPGLMDKRDLVWLHVAGRLRDGVTAAQATDEVNAIYRRLHTSRNATETGTRATLVPVSVLAVGFSSIGDLQRLIAVLMGATLVTLLLACATVANLLLVRAERRRHELAVRAALGAGRARIARLLLVESLSIGMVGGLTGLGIARLGLGLLGAFSLPGNILIADLHLPIDLTMAAVACGMGLATSLAFGIAPVWQTTRVGLLPALRDGARGSSRQPLRSALVNSQVALAVVLLGGSLAFGRSIQHALAINLGFDTRTTTLTTIDPTLVRYTADQMLDVQARAEDALHAMPWVQAAGWSAMQPLRGGMQFTVGIDGYTPAHNESLDIETNLVSPGYFDAMGMHVLSGRGIEPRDRSDSAGVVVVNARFAKRYFHDGHAVGRRITLDPDATPIEWATIVGVVNDVRRGLERAPEPMVYLVQSQWKRMMDFGGQVLVVRSSLTPDVTLTNVSHVLASIDSLVPLTKRQTMRDHVGDVLMAQRLGLTLFALFAGLAVVLTTLGIYAVVASAIAHRTREIGIRVALGAAPRGVLRLVVRQGLVPIGAGLGIGLVAFTLASSVIDRFMFALPANNALTLTLLTGSIGILAVMAMLVPARRALRVNPVIALRNE
jgi:predicted permease